MKKTAMGVLLAAGLAMAAQAGVPLQLGLAGDPVQVFAAERPVTGLKLNVPFAESESAAGIDVGFVGSVGDFTGLRLNAVNLSTGNVTGLEIGLANIGKGFVRGMQFGGFNHAEDMHGFQLGIVNTAGNLKGLQVGLLNLVTAGSVQALPFVIWAF